MLKKTLLLIILIVFGLSLTSCQTVQGVGEDITWLGEKSAEIMEGE